MNPYTRDQHKSMWFYVPNYELVRARLELAYAMFCVEEHSAEPGRCNDTGADIICEGSPTAIVRLWNWLVDSNIEGLMLEGRDVRWRLPA